MDSSHVACLSYSKFARNVKLPVCSIAFAFTFAPIDPWSGPLAAFAFTFASGHALQSLYLLFHILSHSQRFVLVIKQNL